MKDLLFLHQQKVKDAPLDWQRHGLMETASGYGARLTTSKMVFWAGRWRRLYCACYGNSGSVYVFVKGAKVWFLD